MPTTTTSSPRRAPSANSGKPGSPGAVPIKTLTFDSAGPRKYALQLAKAGNGNPCLKLVEGVPQPDGTYR